jgi:fumarate hydratase class II
VDYRIEKDVLGELKVPKDVYWGINTQRAIDDFQISGRTLPAIFIESLAQLKKACLQANMELGLINQEEGNCILKAIQEMLDEKKFADQFPIDVFQTGSGTQTNMNINEVLANRANQLLGYEMGKKYPIHPNDHVNKGQSSNDVIPSAMHISTIRSISEQLLPALTNLKKTLDQKIKQFNGIVKVGRTHLQDAVPIPLSLEFSVYHSQIMTAIERINQVLNELYFLPIGGTAVGTGLNTHKNFDQLTIKYLKDIIRIPFKSNPVKAESIASHNILVNASAILRSLSLTLLKMANDIRWMGSGPRAGLSELILPQNEPGSSIMPGKINPTQSEALIQVCLQVIGNDSVISFSEGFGSILDLNVCKPILIYNLLYSIKILSAGISSFIRHCLIGLEVNEIQIDSQLKRMLMVVTNLAPIIGYDMCSIIAQKAYKEGKTIKQVIIEMQIDIEGDLDKLLDPRTMV